MTYPPMWLKHIPHVASEIMVIISFLTLRLQLKTWKPLCQRELTRHPLNGASVWHLLGLLHLHGPVCSEHPRWFSSKYMNQDKICVMFSFIWNIHITFILWENWPTLIWKPQYQIYQAWMLQITPRLAIWILHLNTNITHNTTLKLMAFVLANSVDALERQHVLVKAFLGFTLWFCLAVAFVSSEQTLLHLFTFIWQCLKSV